MCEISGENGRNERSLEEGVNGNSKGSVQVHMGDENSHAAAAPKSIRKSSFQLSVPFLQKVIFTFIRKKKITLILNSKQLVN